MESNQSNLVSASKEGQSESALHLAAKNILSNAKRMILPPVYVVFPDSYKAGELVYDATEIAIDEEKLTKFRQADISIIEIDLSKKRKLH